MKISDYISEIVQRLPLGYVFTYEDFPQEVKNKEAVIKALNRMAASGKITKLTKGKYYKPEKSPFGELAPPQYQVVKDLLESNGKTIGYLTGLSIYNDLGLTTQVSNTIQIGKNEVRPTFTRERYTIKCLKQKNTITKENIALLQVLDSVSTIKKIPDCTIEQACERLQAILNGVTEKDEKTMVRLAQKYSPSTRALLGALLENIGRNDNLEAIRKSLNGISTYKLPGAEKVLATTESWNIK